MEDEELQGSARGPARRGWLKGLLFAVLMLLALAAGSSFLGFGTGDPDDAHPGRGSVIVESGGGVDSERVPGSAPGAGLFAGGARGQGREEGKASAGVLRFAFDGRFSELPVRALATLSSDQAARLFGKVERWADESGLDGLLFKKNITMPLPPAHIHQRQKLWGTGSYQQIGAFLQKLQQVEEIAVLGEVELMPIKGDEQGWAEARLYAAVDVVVGMP